ncbi:D-ribose pyranase [Anaeromicrobium sediminis]|uniref:D-ribose pyranase n=1 Tax=Anaeromicrobium sediminis TaxID=1478221 RepID=A0A267MP34_9FIRM|nr:D-ribose pyranase [Anaeromicrobium sediminis]PAB60500.1 D-ribose pyranase [Anaeromicrobium sediminis]
MKKALLINSEISYVISKMGHTDHITICDSGLPVPNNVQRIDLALKEGIPSFLDTLETVLEELKVEEVVIAGEMINISKDLHDKMIDMIKSKAGEKVLLTYVSHEEFKEETRESKAIVRTGEFTPYANVILKSGVVF